MNFNITSPITMMDDAKQSIWHAICRAYDDINAGADFLSNNQLMYIIRCGLRYHMANIKLTGASTLTESDKCADVINPLLEMEDAKESIRNIILYMFKRMDVEKDSLSYEELMYIVRQSLQYHMANTIWEERFCMVSKPPIEETFPLESNMDLEAELRALNAECDVDKEVSDSLYDYVSESRSEESTDWDIEELEQLSEKCRVSSKGVPSCQ